MAFSLITPLTPSNPTLEIFLGQDYRQNFSFATYVSPGVTTPFNFTGFVGNGTVRITPHQPPIYQLSTTGGSINFPIAASGYLQIYIPAAITIGFTWPSAVFDLYLTDVNGNYFSPGDTEPFMIGQIQTRGIRP